MQTVFETETKNKIKKQNMKKNKKERNKSTGKCLEQLFIKSFFEN